LKLIFTVSLREQMFRGIYQGPFVLQTFCAHYIAVRNAMRVPAILMRPLHPASALALATATVSACIDIDAHILTIFQCERAFRLWANGDLLITNGSGAINKGTNLATGRETKDMAFTELNWGKATRGYLASIHKMSAEAFDQAVEQAQEFARSGRFGDLQGSVEEDEELEHAALVKFCYNCT
jgi:hypothetical protein